jgi:hypothetical protein
LPPSNLRSVRRLYLKWAIQKLRQSLRFEEAKNRRYLIAELCRRNGNFLLSASYFRRFIDDEDGSLPKAAVSCFAAPSRRRRNGDGEGVYGRRPAPRDFRAAFVALALVPAIPLPRSTR